MRKNRVFDDIAVIANGIAGLGNDAIIHARHKRAKIQKTLNITEEIESLKLRIMMLESKINDLEKHPRK